MPRNNIDDVNIFLGIECSLGNPLSRFVINKLSKKNNGSRLIERMRRVQGAGVYLHREY